jgi:hypothetical protein
MKNLLNLVCFIFLVDFYETRLFFSITFRHCTVLRTEVAEFRKNQLLAPEKLKYLNRSN